MNAAEQCRKNGWRVGQILVGREGWHSAIMGAYWQDDAIEITAIGKDSILAQCVARRTIAVDWRSVDARETLWTLNCREWKPIARIPVAGDE